ncbi:hypothetical protein ACOSP7_026840 [Xanthoceras sorbifolium]
MDKFTLANLGGLKEDSDGCNSSKCVPSYLPHDFDVLRGCPVLHDSFVKSGSLEGNSVMEESCIESGCIATVPGQIKNKKTHGVDTSMAFQRMVVRGSEIRDFRSLIECVPFDHQCSKLAAATMENFGDRQGDVATFSNGIEKNGPKYQNQTICNGGLGKKEGVAEIGEMVGDLLNGVLHRDNNGQIFQKDQSWGLSDSIFL